MICVHSTPKRILKTLSSLGVNVDKIFVVASPKFDLIACSKGARAFVSSIKSPKLLSSYLQQASQVIRAL